jgi:hypothetical protein
MKAYSTPKASVAGNILIFQVHAAMLWFCYGHIYEERLVTVIG